MYDPRLIEDVLKEHAATAATQSPGGFKCPQKPPRPHHFRQWHGAIANSRPAPQPHRCFLPTI